MIRIDEILKIKYIRYIENINIESFSKITPLKESIDNTITWCNDLSENIDYVNNTSNRLVILGENTYNNVTNKKNNYLITTTPRFTFKEVLNLYTNNDTPLIGKNVVIEDNVVIGKNVRIGHNTVILANTIIKDNVIIGSNNTIGGTGFGYEKNEKGEFELIPHVGGVIIHKNVEIGNNTCIDRGVINDTIIGENTKIDNLVHIAHNVKIGKNCAIIANAMVAGSVIIENDVWVAPSASILNQLHIKEGSIIGLGCTLIKSDEPGIYIGNPGKIMKNK